MTEREQQAVAANKDLNAKFKKTITDTLEEKKKKLNAELNNRSNFDEEEKVLAQKKKAVEKEENLLARKGPIINVDQFIKDNFNSKI